LTFEKYILTSVAITQNFIAHAAGHILSFAKERMQRTLKGGAALPVDF